MRRYFSRTDFAIKEDNESKTTRIAATAITVVVVVAAAGTRTTLTVP